MKTKILLPTRDEQALIQRGKGSEKVTSLQVILFFSLKIGLKYIKPKLVQALYFYHGGSILSINNSIIVNFDNKQFVDIHLMKVMF